MCVELSAMLRVDQLGQIFACTVWEYDLLSQRHEYKGSDMRLDGCMVNKFPLYYLHADIDVHVRQCSY